MSFAFCRERGEARTIPRVSCCRCAMCVACAVRGAGVRPVLMTPARDLSRVRSELPLRLARGLRCFRCGCDLTFAQSLEL